MTKKQMLEKIAEGYEKEFNSITPSVYIVAERFWGIKSKSTISKLANEQNLPTPVFRTSKGQKGEWCVSVFELAKLAFVKMKQAEKDHACSNLT